MKHYMCTVVGDVSDEAVADLFNLVKQACIQAGADIRREVKYRFEPQGFTAVFVLAESHATIHTWPEDGFAMIDYFSCAPNPNIDVFSATLREYYQITSEVTVEREV